MGELPQEAGKSSFDLIDHEALFGALPLRGVQLALDLGCGTGRYTADLASRLKGGEVVGFDLWPEGIAELRRQTTSRGLAHCTGVVADIASLPEVADSTADLVLYGTVLHDLVPRGSAGAALDEASRVLRRGGWLAVVEFHPRDTHPGPPLSVRLAPQQVDTLVAPHGFEAAGVTDLGTSCYLALYRRA